MKKKNKIGMTVVELVVVIALLSLMLAIAIPIVTGTIRSQKEKLYDVQIESIKKGAVAWGSANLYLMPHNNGDTITITLGELKSKGFVKKDLTNPKTEQRFGDNVLVVVTKKNNSYLYNIENASSSDQGFDNEAPFIILNGSPTEYVEINGGYNEKGVQARNKDGNQIASITTFIMKNGKPASDIKTNELSTYIITYVATDMSNGSSASVSRNVIVHDTLAPTLMVNGININYKMIVKKGSTFNIPDAAVSDNSGEAITATIDGNVNTNVEGDYELIYEAKDSSNNIGRLIIMAVVKNIGKEIFINYKLNTSLWTNQDVVVTILPVHNNPLASQPYSFDGGSTWQSSPSRNYSTNQNIKMQARDDEGQESSIVNYAITNIDKTLPTCNIIGNPTSWVTDATLTVTGNDSDSGVAGIKLPGNSEYLALSSTTLNVTDNGTYIASVKDVAGNTNTCSVTVTKIDKNSPTCNITGNPTTWVTNATLTITGNDSESGVVAIKKPGDSDYTATTSSTTFNVTNNGTYTAYVKDGVSRIGTCNVNVTKVDNTDPSTPTVTLKLDSINGSIYTSGVWTNHSVVQIPYSTDIDSGINKYQYSNDTTNWYDMSNPRTVTNEENQTYYVRSIDNVGHVSTISVLHNIKIDKTAPTCASTGGSSTWRSTDLTLTGTCSDGDSLCAAATVIKIYANEINSTTESPGSVSDNAGNSTVCPANQTVKIDKTAPTCASSGGSATWRNTTLTLTGTCSDGGSGCVSNITKNYTNEINSTTESPGSVSDNAGNSVTCSANQTVRIDKTAPTCASSGGSATWRNTTLTLTGTCSDGGSGCAGNITKNYTNEINSTTESPGSVSDNAGNSVTCSANQTVRIDKTAPTCASSGGSSTWRNTTLTLTGTCSDGGSGCAGNITKNYTNEINSTTESPGSVSDNAGNSVTCSANQTVRIDKTAPTCASSGGSSTWRNTTLTLTGTCSDGGSGCVSNITKSYTNEINSTTESPGSVSDNAGNSVTCSANQTVRIDKTVPTCASSGGSATWRNTNLTLTGTCSDTGGSGCVANVTKAYSVNTNSTTESPGNVNDTAGNSFTCPANQTVKIDKTAPTCTPSGGSATWRNTDLTITGTCSDTGGSGCVGNVTKAYSANTNSTTESPGSVSDNAGNSVTCSANQTVKIDKTAPTCTSSGGSATWRNTNLTLTGTCSDTGGSGCVGNITKVYSVNTNSTTESPGNVNDTAGNSFTCPANQTVKMDKTAPTVTYSPNGNPTQTQSQSSTVTVNDSGGSNISSLQYEWSTSNTVQPTFATTFTSGQTLTKAINSTVTYYLWVKAVDGAGNTAITTSNAFQFIQLHYIYYAVGSGTGAPATTTYTGSGTYLSSVAPTRTGYIFTGWSTTAGGAAIYHPGDYYTGSDTTLYAVYCVQIYEWSNITDSWWWCQGVATHTYYRNLSFNSTNGVFTLSSRIDGVSGSSAESNGYYRCFNHLAAEVPYYCEGQSGGQSSCPCPGIVVDWHTSAYTDTNCSVKGSNGAYYGIQYWHADVTASTQCTH